MKARIVDGLERACWTMRHFERLPLLGHLYPRCLFARWSWALDRRWGTQRWPYSDEDEWDTWWDGLSDAEKFGGARWHVW